MVNINHVKTFLKVINTGSLSAAAEKLGLTQPAVTLHIQNLEDYFGVTLLNRKGRALEITGPGKILYDQGTTMLKMYEDCENSILHQINQLKRKILVGAGPIMTDYVIPHIIALFRQARPGIEIIVDSSETNLIVKGVLDHTYDLGFVGYPVKNNKLRIEEWVKDELLVIVPADHPFTAKKEITATELLSEEFVWRKEFTGIRMFFEQALKKAGLGPSGKPYLEVSSTLSVLTSVQAGLGVSLISRWVAEKYIEMGMIANVPVKDLDLTRNLYMVTHELKRLTPVVEEFITAAKVYREKANL